MTMAPGKKRSFWLEIAFISILLFLLMGARSQNHRAADAGVGVKALSAVGGHHSFFGAPTPLK